MVELACAGDPRLVPSRIEEGQGKSYSMNTIERVKAEGGELFFIIGADAFADITIWHRAQDVIRSVEFVVVGRPGFKYEVPAGARVHRLDTLELPVSSSRIREQLACGERVEELPKKVAEYIRENALYLNPH
jgi:nicotinate-nucleotide adenylyltransferase